MMDGGVTTSDVWFSAVLSFAGYELARVNLIDERTTGWTFLIESEDAKIMREDYDAGNLALSDAKAFVNAFNRLAQHQREMRRQGESDWCSPAWINGKTADGRKLA